MCDETPRGGASGSDAAGSAAPGLATLKEATTMKTHTYKTFEITPPAYSVSSASANGFLLGGLLDESWAGVLSCREQVSS